MVPVTQKISTSLLDPHDHLNIVNIMTLMNLVVMVIKGITCQISIPVCLSSNVTRVVGVLMH